jgi:hypothetical protein
MPRKDYSKPWWFDDGRRPSLFTKARGGGVGHREFRYPLSMLFIAGENDEKFQQLLSVFGTLEAMAKTT